MRYTISLLLVFFIACLTQTAGGSKEVFLNQPFELRAGREVSVKGENLKLNFRSVTEDSRCPQGVSCIRAGSAQIEVRVSKGKNVSNVKLNTADTPKQLSFQGYELKLIDLNPFPKANAPIRKKEYVASLVVSKGAQGEAKQQTTGEVKPVGAAPDLSGRRETQDAQLTCLPEDLRPDGIGFLGGDIAQERAIKQRLAELKASCREGKLVDAQNREIRFFRITCWGNPPPDYREIQRQQNEELEALKSRFSVVVVGCPRSLQ